MLVVDLHALQTINVLHFVDHVVCQCLDTHDAQNVMRCWVAVHDVITLLDKVAFLNRNVLALGDHVFDWRQRLIHRFHGDAALVLIVLAKADIPISLGDDRVIFRTTGFEQFSHAGKTPGDVLGLCTFARDTRHNVAGQNILPVFDRQNGVNRHLIGDRIAVICPHRFTRCAVHHNDLRLQIVAAWRRTPIGHDLLRHAGCIVGILADRDTRHKVHKLGHTTLFGNDRKGVGVPFEQLGTTFDGSAVLDVNLCTP